MDGRSWWFSRVVANTLIGAGAGAVPAAAWMVREEWTVGFRDGFGAIAWMMALVAGTLLGAAAGGMVGATGRGVRVVGFGTVIRTLLGACAGAVLGAGIGWQAMGLGDDTAVAAVLLMQCAGIGLGMVLLTAPRSR